LSAGSGAAAAATEELGALKKQEGPGHIRPDQWTPGGISADPRVDHEYERGVAQDRWVFQHEADPIGTRKDLVPKRRYVVPDPRPQSPEPIVGSWMFEPWVLHLVVQDCLPYHFLVNVCVDVY